MPRTHHDPLTSSSSSSCARIVRIVAHAGPSHLRSAVPVEEDVRRLQVAVNCMLRMQETHTSTYIPYNTSGLFLLDRTLVSVQKCAQVPTWHELHYQDQPVDARGDGTVHEYRVGAAKSCHRREFLFEGPSLIPFLVKASITRVICVL